jgi:hypothetical protein
MSDDINHPTHYTQPDKPFECIELTRLCSFDLGNAIKYLWRYKDKSNPVEDLRKAIWYLTDGVDNHMLTMPRPCASQRYLLLRIAVATTIDRPLESRIWIAISEGRYLDAVIFIKTLIGKLKGGDDSEDS